MATVLRGPVTIYPDEAWTAAAASWPVLIVSRETECPDGCVEDHVHGTRHRAHDEGVEETAAPVFEVHLCCFMCPGLPSVFGLSPASPGPAYVVNTADMTAQILAHLRRSHADVVTS